MYSRNIHPKGKAPKMKQKLGGTLGGWYYVYVDIQLTPPQLAI